MAKYGEQSSLGAGTDWGMGQPLAGILDRELGRGKGIGGGGSGRCQGVGTLIPTPYEAPGYLQDRPDMVLGTHFW